MKILKYTSIHTITGRGQVYCIDLIENGISNLRKDFNNELMGKQVILDGKPFLVHGIEAFATGESYVHRNVGLLVRPL